MPLAMVRVRADPVMPPRAVLGKETVDTETDGFALMPPKAVPGKETVDTETDGFGMAAAFNKVAGGT